jgi:hypothetical protein
VLMGARGGARAGVFAQGFLGEAGRAQPWAVKSFSCSPVYFVGIIPNEIKKGGMKMTLLPMARRAQAKKAKL